MKKHILLGGIVAVLAIAVSCGKASVDPNREVLYYANPMDPSIKSSIPMKDQMGMDYIPVYADRAAQREAPVGVDLTETEQRRLGVRSVPAEYRPFGQTLRAVGRIVYDERSWVHVSARYPGRVEVLHADYAGKTVEAGKPLMSVYSPPLVAAQQELLQLSRRNNPADQPFLAGAREKLRLWGISERQIAEILESGTPLYTLPVLSPINGTVIAKTMVEGMYFEEGEMLFEIANLDRLWMEADVYEQDLAHIAVGALVEMSSVAHPGTVFTGKISFIAPVLDPSTRTVRIRADIDNRRGLLKPNMYVETVINKGSAPPRLVVPATAVLDTGQRKIVYVDEGNGRFVGYRVQVEATLGEYKAISAGLREGDLVVVSGAFLIDSQAQLLGVQDREPESRL